MIVLGFDTATMSTTVGLRLGDGEALTMRDDPAPGERPGHATRLLSMTEELLARTGVAWSALDRIAVGVGPGRFTGLRVGIATARGLAQSLSAELVGVSSPMALAAGAVPAADAYPQEDRPRVLAVIDALRGEAFAGAYRASEPSLVAELLPPRAMAPEELGDVLARVEQLDTEPGEGWIAVGDGAIRFRDHLGLAAVTVPPDPSPLHLVDARYVCELGASAAAAGSYEEIVPDYRRRADAETAMQGAAAGGTRP